MTTYCNIGMVDDDGKGRYISLALLEDPRDFGNTLLKDYNDFDAVADLVAGGQMGAKLNGINAMAYRLEDADVVIPRTFVGGMDGFFSNVSDYAYCWSSSKGWMFRHNDITKALAYG